MKTKKKEIYNRLVKSIKSSKSRGYRSSFTERRTRKTKSFSPIINRNLDVKMLKTLKNESVNLCNNLYKNNIEGLDNCPPLDGITTTGMQNQATLSSIKKNVDNINNNIANRVANNTSKLTALNNSLKGILDLKQQVTDLANREKKLKQSLANFGNQLQAKGLSLANTTKKDMPNPLPQVQANPYSGKRRTD